MRTLDEDTRISPSYFTSSPLGHVKAQRQGLGLLVEFEGLRIQIHVVINLRICLFTYT